MRTVLLIIAVVLCILASLGVALGQVALFPLGVAFGFASFLPKD